MAGSDSASRGYFVHGMLAGIQRHHGKAERLSRSSERITGMPETGRGNEPGARGKDFGGTQ